MIAAFLGGYFAFQIPELYLIIIMIICLIISGLVMTFYKISDTKNNTQTKGSIREFFVGILISYFGGTVGLALGVLRFQLLFYFLKDEH